MNNGANVCAQLYFRFARRQCIRRLYAVAHQARARRPRDCKLAWPRWPRSARGMAWRIMLPATLATSTQYPHMCSFSSSYGLERFSSARLVRGHIVRGWSCPPPPPPPHPRCAAARRLRLEACNLGHAFARCSAVAGCSLFAATTTCTSAPILKRKRIHCSIAHVWYVGGVDIACVLRRAPMLFLWRCDWTTHV